MPEEPTAGDDERSDPRAAMWIDDISHVVALAADADGLAVDPDAVVRTARLRQLELGRSRHPFLVLAATLRDHGLSASMIRCAPSALLDRVDEGVTLVADVGDAVSGFIVVTLASGGEEPRCYEVIEGQVARRMRAEQALESRLGSEPVDVMAIEAGYPLDILLGPDGSASLFRPLAALLRAERSEILSVLLYAVVVGALTLVVPISAQALVNTIAFGSVLQPLVILGVALFAGMALSAVLQGLRYHVVEQLQLRLFVRVVNDFTRRFPRLAARRPNADLRELSNRYFEVVALQKTMAALVTEALGLLLQTVMGVILLGFYHPVLMAFVGVLVVAIVALVVVPLKASAKTAIGESKAKYSTAAWLEAVASHPLLFSDARGARYAAARGQRLTQAYLLKRSKHWRLLLSQLAGGLALQVLAMVALLVLGGWLVIRGQLTLGQLVASELVVAIIGAGLARLGKQLEKLYDAVASADKLVQVVTLERERDGGEQIHDEGPAEVALAELKDPRLARSLDFTVAPGENIAIVGPPASGKTLLLRFVYGMATPADGKLLVDGVDLKRVDLRHFRSGVFAIDADVVAPPMAIGEYLHLHAPYATSEEVYAAFETVGIGDVVGDLPAGLETLLSPGGGPLSRSQMLRLSLARLFLQRPRLVLIDESLDGLDHGIASAVLGGPWTILVVTASPAIEALADRVVSLSTDEVAA